MRHSTSPREYVSSSRIRCPRIAPGYGLIGLLGVILACHDDAATTESGTQATATDDPTVGSDTATDGRVLRIPEGFELCTVSPTRYTPSFTSSPLFHFRAVLRLDAGELVLPVGPDVKADAWLPFTLHTGAGEAEIRADEGDGAVSVAVDSVPSAIFSLEEAKGWETVVYTDNPKAATTTGDRLLVQVAYPAGASEFTLAPISTLDRERRLHVIAFVPGVASGEPSMRARAVPCERTDAQVDRVDVTLAEGTISFHTRAALWGRFEGFTVLAEGEIDGVAVEVDSYWDLDYATGDMGEHSYGFLPLMAVRFPAQADGSCILVVEPDRLAFDDSYVARVLDCEQNKLRDLTVESVVVVPDGGENRW